VATPARRRTPCISNHAIQYQRFPPEIGPYIDSAGAPSLMSAFAMSTWVGTIVATDGISEFWKKFAEHGVQQIAFGVPPFVLIDCNIGFDFQASVRLAEALSRDLSTMAIGFVVQTNADVHELHTYRRGNCVRRLVYSRDEGGWIVAEGEPQSWEHAYFFGGVSTGEGSTWPDLLDDDLSEDDLKRFEAAKTASDPMPVLSLFHPSSTAPMLRVCGALGIEGDKPAAKWKKPSFWRRLFGRA